MTWDIYGDRLRSGHCEVHPWVHEEYPCSVCLDESRQSAADKKAEDEYYADMERQYYEQMRLEAGDRFTHA